MITVEDAVISVSVDVNITDVGSAGIVNWRKYELEAMDRKTRKMTTTASNQELTWIVYTSPESMAKED